MRKLCQITITVTLTFSSSLALAQSGGAPSGTVGNAAASHQSTSEERITGALRPNGTTMPGPARQTVTDAQDTDARFEAENRKLNGKVKSICRGC